ncbi:MAG TPA: hypothetical protein VE715_15020 [Blastocatellia bacterium]|nr:hypothetical protein [Blastocatellia bacterium]
MQYISVEHQRVIDKRFKTASIIVFAFCVSIGVFALIGHFITPPEIGFGGGMINSIIAPVVIVLSMGIIILRRVWMWALVMGSATRAGVPATLNRLMQMTFVCAALSETVAIVGLMSYMGTGNYRYSLILCLVSLLLLLYTAFPRRREWMRAVAAAANARN